jgi:hypothetical protein
MSEAAKPVAPTRNVVNNVAVAWSQSATEHAGLIASCLSSLARGNAATHLDEILSDADAEGFLLIAIAD